MDDRVLRRTALVALLCAFAWLGYLVPPHAGTTADVFVARTLEHQASRAADVIFVWISWLGDTALSGLLAIALVILIHRRRWIAAATTVIASIGGMGINDLLKAAYHRSRPDYAIDLLAGTSWSFPSGHAMASIVGFGVLAFFRRELEQNVHHRRLISAVTIAIVLAVGFSRLYLGVHYFTDVLGGFLIGGAWLLLCLEAYRLARTRA